jgi:quercetin dioxygenase-like cupin family protein
MIRVRQRRCHAHATGLYGFCASCAICVASGFVATDASAQGAPPAAMTGLTRKILSQWTVRRRATAEVTIEPGVMVARHTHPGIESGYVIEGGSDLPTQGQPTRTLNAGDSYKVPPETPHAGAPNGDKKATLIIADVVEEG